MLRSFSEISYRAGVMMMFWLFILTIWTTQINFINSNIPFLFFGIACPLIVLTCFVIKREITWKIVFIVSVTACLFWFAILSSALLKENWNIFKMALSQFFLTSVCTFFLMSKETKLYFSSKVSAAQPAAGGNATRWRS